MSTILCPIAGLALNVIVQVIAFRLRRGAHFFRSIVEGFLAGAAAFAALEALLAPHGTALSEYLVLALLVNAPIYAALSYCAYSFIQLGQTSIRIRIYSEIAASPSGVSAGDIEREYDEQALVRVRLERLIESGDLIERNGRYFIGRTRFFHASNVLCTAKRILLGKGSEFH